MNNIERQIEFFKEYGIENEYTVDGDKLIINGSLYLQSLTSCHKDFLKDTVFNGSLDLRSLIECYKNFLKDVKINGFLYLNSLTSCDKDFLKDTTINGNLYLDSLISCHKDFLKGSLINGGLNLDSLTSCHKDFLKGSLINGGLNLDSLTSCHKDFLKDTIINGNLWLNYLSLNRYVYLRSLSYKDRLLLRNNIKQSVEGYNEEKGYCYFDRTLSKVLKVLNKFGYTIYETPFDYIAQKGDFTAHGKTIKKAIEDLEFKISLDKIKNEPIYEDTLVTVEKYRIITGACELGCKNFMENNNIEFTYEDGILKEIDPITVKELLPILEKNNAYGLEKLKSLVK